MRLDDIVWVFAGLVISILLVIGLSACRDYRECRRGGVVLVEGPSRVAAPSHERCVAYLFR